MVFWLLACGPQEVFELPEQPPTGEMFAAFDFELPVNGSSWSLTPAATLHRTQFDLSVELAETWTEPTPYFPDCPLEAHLAAVPHRRDNTRFEAVASDLYDPCAIQAYAEADTYHVRFVSRDQAFEWLEETRHFDLDDLLAGEENLELIHGPATDWFVLWGPEEDVLWPLGHVFASR